MAIPTVARAALVGGPARHLFNGASCFTKSPFEIGWKPVTYSQETEAYGEIDQSILRWELGMDIEPDGQWDAAIIAAFWPYFSMLPGTSVGTAADIPWVVHCMNTEKYTLQAAVIRSCPDIVLGVKNSKIGKVGVTCVLKDGGNPEDTDALVKHETSGGVYAQTGFTQASLKNQRYSGVWGAVAGFTAFQPQENFTISTLVGLEPILVQETLLDYRLKSVGVMVKTVPVGPTAAQIQTAMKHQGASMVPGMSAFAQAAQLQITGADSVNYVTLPKASLVGAGFRFGRTVLRVGEVGFVAFKTFTAGVPGPICTLAAPVA